MRTRKPSLHYYKKITKTLGIYVLASVVCQAYKWVAYDLVVSFRDLIVDTLEFKAANYCWYVEMYIGLFLMIPYLNILYNNIQTKKEKQGLLLIMILLTCLPAVTNTYSFHDPHWWLNPSSSQYYQKILPSWWISIYPITYYFVGCYLNEYPVKLRKRTLFGLLVLFWIFNGSYNFYRSHNAPFIWGDWNSWESLLNLIQTVLVFELISKINCERFSPLVKKTLAKLSDWCFGAYLVSWIFDQYIYLKLIEFEPVMVLRMNYGIFIVPIVFVCSLGLSAVLNGVYAVIAHGLTLLFVKKNNPSMKRTA